MFLCLVFFIFDSYLQYCRRVAHCCQLVIHFSVDPHCYYLSPYYGYVMRGARCCGGDPPRPPLRGRGLVESDPLSCVFSVSFVDFGTRFSLVFHWVEVRRRFQSSWLWSGTCWSGTPSLTRSAAWWWSSSAPCCWRPQGWADLRSRRIRS